jgi:hypothetical protein
MPQSPTFLYIMEKYRKNMGEKIEKEEWNLLYYITKLVQNGLRRGVHVAL